MSINKKLPADLVRLLELHAGDQSADALREAIRQDFGLTSANAAVIAVYHENAALRRRTNRLVREIAHQQRHAALCALELTRPLADVRSGDAVPGTISGQHAGQHFVFPAALHGGENDEFRLEASLPPGSAVACLHLGQFDFAANRISFSEGLELPGPVERKQASSRLAAQEVLHVAADGGETESRPVDFSLVRDASRGYVVRGRLPAGKSADLVVLEIQYRDEQGQAKRLHDCIEIVARKPGTRIGEARVELALPADAGDTKVKAIIRPLRFEDVPLLPAEQAAKFIKQYVDFSLPVADGVGGKSIQPHCEDERAAIQAAGTKCFLQIVAQATGKQRDAAGTAAAEPCDQLDYDEQGDNAFLLNREPHLRAEAPCTRCQTQVVRRFLPKLTDYVESLGLGRDEAEAEAIHGLADYLMQPAGDGTNLRAWLFACTRYAAFKLLRRQYYTEKLPILEVQRRANDNVRLKVPNHQLNGQAYIKVFKCHPGINGQYLSSKRHRATDKVPRIFIVIDGETIDLAPLESVTSLAAKGGKLHVRRRKPVRQMPVADHDDNASAWEPAAPTSSASLTDEEKAEIRDWLTSLPSSQREVVEKRLWDKTFVKIAGELGVDERTVRNRFKAALMNLQRERGE